MLVPRAACSAAQSPATGVIHADQPGARIDRHIYGQFAEHLGRGIEEGVWVGEDSPFPIPAASATTSSPHCATLHVPVIRWPGGCFADEYHWRDGIGPARSAAGQDSTPIGAAFTETNTFGTHEFMDFAEQIGADAYIDGNVGDGSPREMAEWVEYMTSPAGSLADERARNGHAGPVESCRCSASATSSGAAAATCAPTMPPT